ncbi:HlyD family secretion protein [Neptunicella marina]|uniref:HlyD family efflux transporter periplasmic adaptor subunit n=1 Tax=Neptunicella marina TaxID=2125989 RepID=A0A8J6ITN5_9ALTE|nr:HlyD family efflux transporter periplasmic adaptor subunit [Neptunicella marina]MBC3765722.1 HlyD family efflux transporter periplasmic adaptor subunit [Neptunicella marina]
MDKVKTKKQLSWLNKYRLPLILLAATLLVLLLINQVKASFNAVSVNRQHIILATVQHGDLDVTVNGYGVLKPNKMQLLTAQSDATVSEIVRKPGAVVSEDSIIVKLQNPELDQQVNNARQQLALEQANLRQLALTQQRERLDENARLEDIRAQHQSAELKKQAENKLLQAGIISALTYQQTDIQEQQLKQRLAILQARFDQLSKVHQEALKIQQEKIKQHQGQLDIQLARQQALTVRAGFNGVLQKLDVEVGQRLSTGEQIALIGSVTDLVALVNVPQTSMSDVELGQSVTVSIRDEQIKGTVSRIDPIVENNNVEVEVALPEKLPVSARPQQQVDALINTGHLTQVNYLALPANTRANQIKQLYRLLADSNEAQKVEMKFGRIAGRFIEVLSPAAVGEQYVISDLSNYSQSQIHID